MVTLVSVAGCSLLVVPDLGFGLFNIIVDLVGKTGGVADRPPALAGDDGDLTGPAE